MLRTTRARMPRMPRTARTPRTQRALATSVAVAVALSVSALSAGSAGAAAPAQKADKSAVLRYAVDLAAQGGVQFDPANQTNNPAASSWMGMIYDTMIHPTADGKGTPGLAAKWSTPDAQTVEITLKPGLKFTDGNALNAAAVKAAWERVVAANLLITPPAVKAISSIEVIDDLNLRVKLSQPLASAFVSTEMINAQALGVPSPAAIAAGTLNSKPVGAGPYQFQSFTPDQKITLTRNPGYHDKKFQKLGGIEWVQAAYGQPQIAALQGDAADLIWNMTADTVETLERDGFVVTSKPGVRVFDIGLCVSEGPLAKPQARQAIQWAIDRASINAAAVADKGTPTVQLLTEASPFYNKKFEKTYKYNVKKAKALLKEAGVAEGTTLRGLVPTAVPQPTIAEVVQQQLEDVGLKLEITQSTNVPADATRLRPDMTFVAMDSNIAQFGINQTSTLNVCGWNNPTAKAAYATGRDGTKSDAERQKAWDDLTQILLDESPFVFSVVSPLLAASTKNVRGIDVIDSTYGPYLGSISMTK
ncbi:MAG: hypothetical protein AMXMBFR46_19800 [Acidimicrobiia bacterium]